MTAPSLEFPPMQERRFAETLGRLAPDGTLGVAVSGGPDSLALLLLAARVRPGAVEAATVDHGLRPEAGGEAAMVAALSQRLGVPHATLRVQVGSGASLQAQARAARYAALEHWAGERMLSAIATAHHADDQAETLLMRLARGSGLSGLAGIREKRALPSGIRLIRPLLGWRKSQLAQCVRDAGLAPVEDRSNLDRRHDRTWARALLSGTDRLDAVRFARSAAALCEVEEALAYASARLAFERVREEGGAVLVEASGLPRELQRRLLLAGMAKLGCDGASGPEVERALATLLSGGTCTLAGAKLGGGCPWRIAPEPPRRT